MTLSSPELPTSRTSLSFQLVLNKESMEVQVKPIGGLILSIWLNWESSESSKHKTQEESASLITNSRFPSWMMLYKWWSILTNFIREKETLMEDWLESWLRPKTHKCTGTFTVWKSVRLFWMFWGNITLVQLKLHLKFVQYIYTPLITEQSSIGLKTQNCLTITCC